MKKSMSTISLGLRLTFGWVTAILMLTCAVQIMLFFRTQPHWIDLANPWSVQSFEWVLEEGKVALAGKISFLLILAAVILPCGSMRNRSVYTLRRLRISEKWVTVLWALVFSGYFLISWAIQLMLVLWMFSRYAQAADVGVMDLFVASYRSPYFHTLLPLADGWGYVRNAVICLGWGTMGSLLTRFMRHGGKPFMALVLVILTGWLLPRDMATAGNDILLCVLMVALICGQLVLIQGGNENED